MKLKLKLLFGDSDDEEVMMEITVDSGDGDDECSFRLRR
jgi:hypothetical protein